MRRTPFELPNVDALATYEVVRDHVAKGALSMIDWANNKPENRGQTPKVGGHQASCMSAVDILCAWYLHALSPGDRVAVKPHAAPVLYSLMHLMGHLDAPAMRRLRELGGPQPYPTELKAPLYVDYTTSSEALGVCATIYDAYGACRQNRAAAGIGWPRVDATYWAHCGDGELTEGQIDESLYDAGRWGLDNLVWLVDLNRQSLDRVMDDSGRLEAWVEAKFRGQGWEVTQLRWGARAEALFGRDGGAELRALLEVMDDSHFHPLLMLDGAAIRQVLTGSRDVAASASELEPLLAWYEATLEVSAERRAGIVRCLGGLDDATLAAGIGHLGGHDIGALLRASRQALETTGRPVVIIAHTVKGYETSAAAHPENHGAVLPASEVAGWGGARGLPPGVPFPCPEPGSAAAEVIRRRSQTLFGQGHERAPVPLPQLRQHLETVGYSTRRNTSTGAAFQSLNLGLLRSEIAPYVQFAAPDVGQTTHLGPVIKRTGVFAPRDSPDAYGWLRESRRLAFDWRPSATGQFHALGIAEGNALLWAYAFGRHKKVIEGCTPLLPVVTVYDKFFERGFNQLDYAVYSNARFIAVGVPSGTGLSRETATHQSLQTLRMVMDLPGIVAYEPAFGADVHAIYRHALGQLWDPDGEAVYLRLTTVPLAQPDELPEDHEAQAIAGGYWLVGDDDRAPRPGKARVLFVASGRKLAEARAAAAQILAEDGVGSRILNVTSYEVLWREWDAYASDPDAWDDPGRSYRLHELFADQDVNAPLLIIGDHVPSVVEWLPGALQRMRSYRFLGPRRNGEAGALADVDRLHAMAAGDLVTAARREIAWRRHEGLDTP